MVGRTTCVQANAGGVRQVLYCTLCAGVLLWPFLSGSRLVAADLGEVDGWDVRFDNTFRYTAAFRLAGPDAALLADPNADDGDRNFAPGLISNRLDLISELDITNGNFGFDASAAAWYDTVYHQTNNNDSPATFNPYSVPHNQFTHAVQTLHGEDADLLNAFVHGSFDIGDMPATFRLGRHSLLWGESLFFANNGIAAGQAPIDAIKAASEPEAEAKEVYLPVAQASVTLQPRPDLAVSAYYQFEWRRTRLPGSGSYFNDADFLDAGGERIIVSPGQYLYRAPDQTPGTNGQYGVAVTTTQDDFDLGFYALRFSAKEPELFLLPGASPSCCNAGLYQLAFPKGINAYGASFSTYIGNSTIAGELSMRSNMPLVSAATYALASGTGGGYGGYALQSVAFAATPSPVPLTPVTWYAKGDTLHGQLSSVSALAPSSFWDGADLSAEIAANEVLRATQYSYLIDPSRTHFAAAMRAVFEPRYFEVLPALDLSVPIGLGYGLVGRSSTDASLNYGAGDAEIGISATYRTVWQGSITLTHFLGSPETQPFADRDFVSLSVERTF